MLTTERLVLRDFERPTSRRSTRSSPIPRCCATPTRSRATGDRAPGPGSEGVIAHNGVPDRGWPTTSRLPCAPDRRGRRLARHRAVRASAPAATSTTSATSSPPPLGQRLRDRGGAAHPALRVRGAGRAPRLRRVRPGQRRFGAGHGEGRHAARGALPPERDLRTGRLVRRAPVRDPRPRTGRAHRPSETRRLRTASAADLG